jgi:hypothetical protein
MCGKAFSLHSDKRVTNFLLTLAWSLMVFFIFAAIPVCKAVQDRGCEKSGKPVEFREFLHAQGQVKDVPLASFKGQRQSLVRLLRESYKKMKSTKKIINRSIPLLLVVMLKPTRNYLRE